MEKKRPVGRPKGSTAKKAKAKAARIERQARAAAENAAGNKPASKTAQGDIIFALDIGTHSVVGVLAKKTGGICEIIDMYEQVHETRCMADGQIEDIAAVAEDIKKVKTELESRNSVLLSRACIAAAGRALKTVRASWEYKLEKDKLITNEVLKTTELDAVRRTCAEYTAKTQTSDNEPAAFYCVGHSVVSLTLDGFKVTKPEGHRGERLTTELIAAFMPSYVVESLCTAVDEAKLDVASITLEPIAAMNAVIPQELRLINLALCDIGAGTSDVAVSRDGSVVAYGMATTAGDEVTEAVMKELLVDFKTAEMIKTSTDDEITYTDVLLAEHKIKREKVLEITAEMTEELAKVIADEIITANITPPQAVFLVGGSSKLAGLAQLVSKELGIGENRVIVGRKELFRQIKAPEDMALDAEHTTPLGIAVSSGEGVSYDFTTITVNGKRLRALDTNRITVFELLPLAKIKPEQLMAGSGKSLTFTLSGEKITLRGKTSSPAEIIVNGISESLNSVVTKGDEITIIPAQKGEDAAAKLSDYIDMDSAKSFTITAFGEKTRAGIFVFINGALKNADRFIHEGDNIEIQDLSTVSAVAKNLGIEEGEKLLLNGREADGSETLKSGDIITYAMPFTEVKAVSMSEEGAEVYETPAEEHDEKPEEKPQGTTVIVNGITSVFPLREDGKQPIFLDIATAFSDNPTELLSRANTITVNGKIARLDEVIYDGDVIVIE
ncbi:MAG: pilus assembly protein PilM [Oscillospiraceae bacterium]|nr:pilus assembly protein PilM [Oscillospiraceae bacterium]